MDIVDQTVKFWRQTPFVYGVSDCLITIGDYAAARGYRNIASRFRETYHDRAGAEAILEANGGHVGLIDLIGMDRCKPDDIVRGDVVLWDTGTELIGAICTGDGVVGRSARTVFELNRKFVKIDTAWKV